MLRELISQDIDDKIDILKLRVTSASILAEQARAKAAYMERLVKKLRKDIALLQGEKVGIFATAAREKENTK